MIIRHLKTLILAAFLVVGCAGPDEMPVKPPHAESTSRAQTLPSVPVEWEADLALKIIVQPECPKDALDSIGLQRSLRPMQFDLQLTVGSDGRVMEAKVISADPPDAATSAYGNFASDCVSTAVFEKPPYHPYRLDFTFRIQPSIK